VDVLGKVVQEGLLAAAAHISALLACHPSPLPPVIGQPASEACMSGVGLLGSSSVIQNTVQGARDQSHPTASWATQPGMQAITGGASASALPPLNHRCRSSAKYIVVAAACYLHRQPCGAKMLQYKRMLKHMALLNRVCQYIVCRCRMPARRNWQTMHHQQRGHLPHMSIAGLATERYHDDCLTVCAGPHDVGMHFHPVFNVQ
jgi:hypothetical protein